MSGLLELAERCEQATGKDKALDGAIYRALAIIPHPRQGLVYPNYAYTGSLDAAVSLVPEGWVWSGHFDPRASRACVLAQDGFEQHHTMATTPALALCAASLRARAAGGVEQ